MESSLALAGFLANAGLLSLGSKAILLIVMERPPDGPSRLYDTTLALSFGILAAIIVIFTDFTRNVAALQSWSAPIIMAGILIGPLGAVIVSTATAFAHLYVGGETLYSSLTATFVYGAFGYLVFFYLESSSSRKLRRRDLIWIAAGSVLIAVPTFFVGRSIVDGATILREGIDQLAFGNAIGIAIVGSLLVTLEAMKQRAIQAEWSIAQANLALEASGAGLWFFDPNLNEIEFDDLSMSLLDIGNDQNHYTISGFARLLHSEDSARVLRTLERTIADGRRFTIRARAVRGSGRIVNLEISAKSTGAIQGKQVFAGTLRDVTAEEEQLTRIRLNNLALDKAANGVVICKADGNLSIVYVNEAFTEMTGYGVTEVLGQNAQFLAGIEQDQEGIDVLRDAFRKAEACATVVRNYRKDGTPFWNRITLMPMHDLSGVLTHYVSIMVDITHQREIEAAVERNKERLEAVLSSAPDAIITVDENLHVQEFNTAAERFFGWARVDIIGRPIGVLVPSAYSRNHDDLARGFVSSGASGSRVIADWRNIEGLRADGTTFQVLVTLSRFIVDGKPAVTAIARDMTSVAEMNRELFEMSNQLVRQLHEVQEANEAKSRFLAGMSHELRTPLNAIIGFSESIKNQYFGPIANDKYEEYVGDINDSAQHLLSLINDLLDLTAIENDRLALSLEPVDLSEAIKNAVQAVSTLTDAKSQTLTITDECEGEMVRADKRALHQCLLNLLSNAIKFTPDKGMLSVEAERAGEFAVIRVCDNGMGIPTELLQKIGLPFQQAGNPMHAETKGTGLGLAITKRLTENMGGAMKVESVPDAGTMVSLTLRIEKLHARATGTSNAVIHDFSSGRPRSK